MRFDLRAIQTEVGDRPIGNAASSGVDVNISRDREDSTASMIEIAINGRFLSQPTSGVQKVARELVREIDAILVDRSRDMSVRLICPPDADPGQLPLKRISVVQTTWGRGHLWEQIVLPMAVGGSILLCLGNTAPVLSLASGRPVAVVIHDLAYRVYPNAYRHRYRAFHSLLLPSLLQHANPIITVSECEREILARLAPAARDRLIAAQNGGWRETGVVARQATSAYADLPEPGYALYVGSLTKRKNLAGLLDVAQRLAQEDGLRFVFVGSMGAVHTPTALKLPAHIRDKVIFLGHIEELDRLAEIYRRARCFVFPSFYESSPLPPLEAMHFGCPVVGADIPSMRERCGDAAEYCDPMNVDSVLAAVRRIISDAAHARNLADRGRLRAVQFSWRDQAKLILESVSLARRDCPQPLHTTRAVI